jgi:8-oxo-dGTP diphosphatase
MISCTFEDFGTGSLRHVVVDALVLKNKEILLTKRAEGLLEAGKWGLIGGFLDRDETIEEGTKREVFEETGWRVKNLKLIKIIDNPNRPHEGGRQNVAMVFVCEATKQEGEPDWESEKIQWFGLDRLPKKETIAFDHYEAIQFYLDSNK